ncbi:MAG: phage baseplate assembly protein V [Rhodoferax sp.]
MRFRARAGTIVGVDKPIAQPESPFEILRRMENMVRAGVVHSVRHAAPARCRVKTGGLVSNWIPWWVLRAGGQQRNHWWPPVPGEQCLLLCPGGDLLNAVALCGMYSDAMPQNSDNPNICRTDWSPTDFMEHDSDTSRLDIYCDQGITLRVGTSVLEITRNAIVLSSNGGTLKVDAAGATAAPDVIAGGISLVKHQHGGVTVGNASTGRPL